MSECFGIACDQNYRCQHYHSELDIVGLKCAACQRYYACFSCHDLLADHTFHPTNQQEPYPVICGGCHRYLSRCDYKLGACPFCRSAFNPACHKHSDIYFMKES
ncbi:CHY zinc finger protein [Streptococcus phocae]|uniref:CHY zinc finger protein n=1 Tax=Streptococcus phocae TaxID=119224 RepID=UPI0009E9D543|nr:CHY zinc finger protein [Streptococcus phocae]